MKYKYTTANIILLAMLIIQIVLFEERKKLQRLSILSRNQKTNLEI